MPLCFFSCRSHDLVPVSFIAVDQPRMQGIIPLGADRITRHADFSYLRYLTAVFTLFYLFFRHSIHDSIHVPTTQADVLTFFHFYIGKSYRKNRKEHKNCQKDSTHQYQIFALIPKKGSLCHPFDDLLIIIFQHLHHFPSVFFRPQYRRSGLRAAQYPYRE